MAGSTFFGSNSGGNPSGCRRFHVWDQVAFATP